MSDQSEYPLMNTQQMIEWAKKAYGDDVKSLYPPNAVNVHLIKIIDRTYRDTDEEKQWIAAAQGLFNSSPVQVVSIAGGNVISSKEHVVGTFNKYGGSVWDGKGGLTPVLIVGENWEAVNEDKVKKEGRSLTWLDERFRGQKLLARDYTMAKYDVGGCIGVDTRIQKKEE